MQRFAKGQTVICTDAADCSAITEGQAYTVKRVDYAENFGLVVLEEAREFLKSGYSAHRFRALREGETPPPRPGFPWGSALFVLVTVAIIAGLFWLAVRP